MSLYAIVGTGGHGREVMSLARRLPELTEAKEEAKDAELVFVDVQPIHTSINGYRVLSVEQFLSHPDEKRFNPAVADHQVRRRVADQFEREGAQPFSIRASNAFELDDNTIGVGLVLGPFTLITTNARIGRYFHAAAYAYVAHDCVIGDFVSFGPAVKCNGNVIVEDGAYIGAGAMLRQGTTDKPLVIGAGAVVGMGAVVTRSVAAGQTVIGNPARLVD